MTYLILFEGNMDAFQTEYKAQFLRFDPTKKSA